MEIRIRIAGSSALWAGETVCKPTLAAVANAIFDATGVRIRRVPFRDARVLAALRANNV
jgi:nicotinate dehydrogenase subunit B